MTSILKNNKWLLIIFAAFVFTRFLGLGQIYHQDEYRWASIANPFFEELGSPHPPLPEYLYKFAGKFFGFDNLRVVPLFFSFLNLILIYFVSLKISRNNRPIRNLTGESRPKGAEKIALTAVGLFAVNIYSLIANLQIDIDGAILPFFILLGAYAYFNILETPRSKKWLAVLTLAVIGGFFTKLSYLLFVAAIIADQGLRFYYERGSGLKNIFNRLWPWIFGFLGVAALFYYFYVSNFERIITYAKNFNSLNFTSRAYFDLLFKIFKSFVWWSPLLALPIIYGFFKKELLRKYQFWFVYLLFNFIFYLVLFDFSTLTVERYFMFLIVPSILIGAEAIYGLSGGNSVPKKRYIFAFAGFILLLLGVLFLPHDVIPLNPKEAYVDRIKSLDFRFLIPFTGGSGPSGFYFSSLFIMLSWLISIIAFLYCCIAKKYREIALVIFVVIGLGYNILFSGEYLYGSLYGSVDKIAKETIEYANSSDSVEHIITYNDIGAYYLRLSGKYYSRFYTASKRDYSPKIESYRGQYIIVDFPAIDKDGRYWPLIARCPILKKFQDKKIESYIFDCSKI